MARKSIIKRFVRAVAWVLFALILLFVSLLLLFRYVNPPTSAFILGYSIAHPGQEVRQQWVSFPDISPWMPLAVVASEDQRFPDHRGIDFLAIRQALAEYRAGEGLRGASTITQQTAKNLFLWNGRSFVRKTLEAGLALAVDGLWPKRRILEVYLNIAEFGPGIYGVEAASQVYFGISARHLSAAQAARLAAVLPNPAVLSVAVPSTYVRDRAFWIRGQMDQLSGLQYLKNL
ncbi:monofunctional biosynthetic peptidoglycan transglycosylase [Marinobacter sp. F3R11]|uniref:monofunctional biosynthetic peptidoglycan transglycosylase n=1 Tax=Marinobacter sp. F3R11 TaxID=2267231 RepID=UPI000DEA9E45|nr:monofunctional biosynthetic peptidoglycan transglycosylase [Marinobacter sp. F3R11]RBW48460.1 monofunctional biosynthetic peptidoglycan transglycosylase [Marinobacter sp. F3R11]